MIDIGLTEIASLATILSFVWAVVVYFKYKKEKNSKELFEKKYEQLEASYKSLTDSSGIVNELPKDKVRTTTVQQFIHDSKEGNLKFGDCVSIATNDLTYYDLLPEYINLLIDNIKKGVVYKYYIPDDAALRNQANQLCKLIIDNVGFDIGVQILKNVSFYRTSIHIIYNISVVKEQGENKCYWYFAFSPDKEGDNLCIVTFKERHGSTIMKIMAKIDERSILENIKLSTQ